MNSNETGEKPVTIYAAMAANLGIALAKLAAAFLTRSSAMLSEGIHSLADTGNQGLMLLGNHLSKKPADRSHPFGYGMEIYFWSLIVALILFGLGGGLSAYEGITHLQNPPQLEDPTWNYVVLGVAALLEGTSFTIALRKLMVHRNAGENVIQAVHTSKNPEIFLVLFEDSAALVGILIAFLAVLLGHLFDNPYLDGVGSLLIGVVLGIVAIFLAYETRLLLLGEGAEQPMVAAICRMIKDDRDVLGVARPMTMYFGPHHVLLNIAIHFKEDVSTKDLVRIVDRLESQVRKAYPIIRQIYIEAESFKIGNPEQEELEDCAE